MESRKSLFAGCMMLRPKMLIIGSLLVVSLCLPAAGSRGDGTASLTPCISLRQKVEGYQEELTYTISWGMISAGTAILRLTPQHEPGQEPVFRIDSEARSNKVIDVFFKVRDKLVSLADAGFRRSLYYSKKQREGSFSRDEVIEYDSEDGVGILFRDEKVENYIRLPEEFQDPISGLYSFRTLPAKPGDEISMYATDGRRLMLVRSIVLSREKLTVPAGTFDCLKVELFGKTLEGPFKRKKHGRVFVWFTDDDCRLPVKMSSEIIIGAIETVLKEVSYKPLGR